MRLSTRVIGVSQAMSQGICAAGLPPEKSVTIYNPVDLDAFDRAHSRASAVRARLGIADGDVAVGVFGRIIPAKGHIEFVEACIQAIQENPRIRAVIVGDVSDGPPEYFEAFDSRIRASACSDRFILTGYQEDVEAFYAAMDIIVNPASDPNMFGLDRVIGEGMAAGRPVIATAAEGPRELVDSGVDGLLVAPGDSRELAVAIGRLASDPAERSRLATAARRKAEALFDFRHAADQVQAVYRAILADGES